MSEIDPQTVRDFARRAILTAADEVDYLGIGEQFSDEEGWPDEEGAYDAMLAAVDAERKKATVAVTWPDEQTGPTVGQLRHIIDEQAHRIQSGLDRIAELEAERDNDLCVMAAFLRPTRRSTAEWHAILANHFESRANALLRDDARFAAARARVEGGV